VALTPRHFVVEHDLGPEHLPVEQDGRRKIAREKVSVMEIAFDGRLPG
jgi:hypothetical protein